ncbi:MAG TPA: ABC transporter permease [Candidatus Sulfotelmatobacter sp.]|nr:ABC transporter permease [Candidatus Sulfotelmatobacter sp.]
MENLLQDVRYALRQLRKSPGFAVTAILILTLGIGASTAIFGFVDAALIRPLPYRDPARLMDVTESAAMFPRANLSYPDFVDWKRLNQVFSSFDAYHGDGYLLRTDSGTEPVDSVRVTAGFFQTLGVTPAIGRDFHAGEDQLEAPQTVILSYATWQKRFAGEKNVLGSVVMLNNVPYTVIGVLPHNFQFAAEGNAEFWTTLRQDNRCLKRRSCHNMYAIGRLKDGVSVEMARSNMKTIARQLEIQYPNDNRGQGAAVAPLEEVFVKDVRPILLALLGGAGLLLLIACVNVSSLLLVRSASRKREIAVRGALGATRLRLTRQFFTEGFALACVSALLGIVLARFFMQTLVGLVSKNMLGNMPYLAGLGLNLHVVGFAAAVALVATILFSLTPIFRLPLHEIRDGLAESGRTSSGTVWRRFGANLVVVELAVAVVLLACAGLLGKSLYRLLHVEVGFQPDHLATMTVALSPTAYEKNEQQAAVGKKLVARMESLPGVRSAALSSVLPVSFNGNTTWMRILGHPYNGEHNEVNQRDVSPEFFSTIRASLAEGRCFTEFDDASKPRVVIINQALAKKYFPGEDPIGKKIGDTDLSPKSLAEVVGVVRDIRDGSLDSEIWPAVYYPFAQSPDTDFNLVVRTSQSEAALLQPMVNGVREVDPGIGTMNQMTMAAKIDQSPTAYLHRSSAWLVGGFACVALLLGIVGLYGVIAYSVGRRTREIGVRMALGAQRGAVYELIMREAAWLVGIGIMLGLLSAVGAATLIRGLLFGVTSWDASTLVVVAFVLSVFALLASYFPARRAAQVEPTVALRYE